MLADWIAGSLMRDLAALEDLQKALRHAEDLLHRTHRLNNQSQTTLWKLQVTQEHIILVFSFMLSSWSLSGINFSHALLWNQLPDDPPRWQFQV